MPVCLVIFRTCVYLTSLNVIGHCNYAELTHLLIYDHPLGSVQLPALISNWMASSEEAFEGN